MKGERSEQKEAGLAFNCRGFLPITACLRLVRLLFIPSIPAQCGYFQQTLACRGSAAMRATLQVLNGVSGSAAFTSCRRI